jgi:hypothetical protein
VSNSGNSGELYVIMSNIAVIRMNLTGDAASKFKLTTTPDPLPPSTVVSHLG